MKNKFSLQAYAGFATSFLLMNKETNAQAVYTDIEPDIILEFNNDEANIDLDDAGGIDFVLLKTSGTYTDFIASTTYTLFRSAVWASPAISENEIAAESVTHGAGYGTGFYVYALNLNSLIDENIEFQNGDYQRMALKFLEIDDTIWHQRPGFWGYDSLDHYLGGHFIDDELCYHYGWIRCAVMEGGERLIIKDYAYETKCEIGIKAGDKIGDTTVSINEVNQIDAVVYNFNNTIYVQLNEILNDGIISIFDITGKEIYAQTIDKQFFEIKLNEPEGVYLVEINSGEGRLVKKVFITK
ncbi:MAG: T9SS type A sorting domain-containing protein [Chitinophagales bacterium]